MIRVLSADKYKSLCDYLTSTVGAVSEGDHSVGISEVRYIERIFSTLDVRVQILHSNCFTCSKNNKVCNASDVIDEFIAKLD